MVNEVKLVRVYVQDWKDLNEILLVEQAIQKKRLSFADLIHELVELKKRLDKGDEGVLQNVQGS